MSYYEHVNGTLHFNENMTDSLWYELEKKLFDFGYEYSDGKECNRMYISGDGNHLSNAIEDIIVPDYDHLIKAAEIYVDGEESDDFWRARKIAGEKEWRYESGYIAYEGEDIPLFPEKVNIDKDKLNALL